MEDTLQQVNGDPFLNPLSRQIWVQKYRHNRERDIGESWRRVASAVAGVEGAAAPRWRRRFEALLQEFRFLPGGRILAGAGTERRVTLFNCFVMGPIEDSMDGIFQALKEGALTMQQGGGVGYDFSTLRPRGTPARETGTLASGPVSFMRIWDTMCTTLLSTGTRRGAMMATLRCDHPDIEEFIAAKSEPGTLSCFNLSVLVSDRFMQAVEADEPWPLLFPLSAFDEGEEGEIIHRRWSHTAEPVPCRVVKRVGARDLWRKLVRAAWDHAEPGVLFIDRINHWNNLGYRERISATNPCGEIPLPPYGACDLGSLNLTAFVRQPFTDRAALDLPALEEAAREAVRFMDDVIDLSRFPLEAQRHQARGSRRIGLGITGLADALVMLGLRYDSEAGVAQAEAAMAAIRHAAYSASIELAREKGAFPWFDRNAYLGRPFIRSLPAEIRRGIARHGIRNSHLNAIAPTGTISLLANNLSSGIEPIFSLRQKRQVTEPDGSRTAFELEDFAWHLWRRNHAGETPPDAFVTTERLQPEDHLRMQAALQRHVDNAISKTINIPVDYPFDDFLAVYARAWALGLKGCTTFRPNPVTGAVLESSATAAPCCRVEEEIR